MFKDFCEREGDPDGTLYRVCQRLEHTANDSRITPHVLTMSNKMIGLNASNNTRRKWIKDLQRCASGEAKACKWVAAAMNSGQKEKYESWEIGEKKAILSMLCNARAHFSDLSQLRGGLVSPG